MARDEAATPPVDLFQIRETLSGMETRVAEQIDISPPPRACNDAVVERPRVLAAVKRVLMRGYCAGWIPAWLVTLAFRLLPLKDL